MSKSKTTRQIIEEKTKGRKHTPLFHPEALRSIGEDFEKWSNSVLREEDRKNWHTTPHTIAGSEIARGLTYSPLDVKEMDYREDIGFSGVDPYTRGLHANMYRGRVFTMRQLSSAGSPKYINERIKWLLNSGATGINLALDLATVQMFDSDEPEAKGQVGTVGVPIDCVEDMDVIFSDIPLDKVSASIVTHYPRNTAILFPMYLVLAEQRGIPWDRLNGSVQNDFIMENLVRSAPEYIPPKDAFRVQCDNIEFLRTNVPRWNSITLNGYNLREAGASGVTEMAVAMANGIEIIKELTRRGHDVDWAAERLAFFWSPASDFFEEVARLRAARRLWYKIIKYRFDAKNPRSVWERCHVQTSGVSLQRQEPMNNVVRAAYHALAAILGGAQSLHVDSYDEAYSVPSEEASLLSLRTQHIIEAETAITQVVDPLGGSYYVEAMTNEIEKRILDEIDEIEKMGGIVQAVESGFLHRSIASYMQHEQRMLEKSDIKVVGRNIYVDPKAKEPEVKVHEYSDELRQEMCVKLEKLRQRRDNGKVNDCLNNLKEACQSGRNVMQYCLEAARVGATKGEMRRVFTDAFGTWRPPISI